MHTEHAWDSYWGSHHTANSFGCDYRENTGPYGVVNRYWLDVFDTFTLSDTVVDLGAGNGALVKLALDALPELPCQQWLSTDIAHIQPPLSHPHVEFSYLDAQAMTYADNSVDRFISMFGVEYADLLLVFDEVARCLTPTGQYQFILHHSDSVISAQSRLTLAVGTRFVTHDFWQQLAQWSNHPVSALKDALLAHLHWQMQHATDAEKEDVQIIGHSLFQCVQATHHVEELIRGLTYIKTQISAQNIRLRAQLDAAQQTESLQHLLEKSSLSCYKITTLTFEDMIIGWSVHGTV